MRYLAVTIGCIAIASLVFCGGCKKEEKTVGAAPVAPAKTVEPAKTATPAAPAKDLGAEVKSKAAAVKSSATTALPTAPAKPAEAVNAAVPKVPKASEGSGE